MTTQGCSYQNPECGTFYRTNNLVSSTNKKRGQRERYHKLSVLRDKPSSVTV